MFLTTKLFVRLFPQPSLMFDGHGKWGLLPGEELPEIEADHTPQSSAETEFCCHAFVSTHKVVLSSRPGQIYRTRAWKFWHHRSFVVTIENSWRI